VIPVLAAVFFVIMWKAVPLFQEVQVKIDRLNLVLDEGLSGVRVIRAFDRGAHESRRFDTANRDLTDTAIAVNRLMALLMPAMFLMMNVTSVLSRDNIAYGREGASDEEIVAAARAAQADHFIRTLPDNYHTMITEEATNLSQGQKQLLTIARAFLADPAILILDEATSSVDTRTEVLIQEAMARLMHGRTTFVIAHRLSTIRNADVILMMEQGRIVEKGTHPGLLAAGGRYAALYQSQFAGRVLTA
jgi:ABC-type multidrug transport system fused ATPase/permease subunit